ncbi:NAD(P)H nitroreductase [Actinocorallia aurea]
MGDQDTRDIEEAVQNAIGAAVWAPSIHNTQPWWFGTAEFDGGVRISLHADPERRLGIADPEGREMTISCGAALATLRMGLLAAGLVPEVEILPDPERPLLLAELTVREHAEAPAEAARLFAEVRDRRTHRGAFAEKGPPEYLMSSLIEEALLEGADLRVLSDPRKTRALGALSEAAEQFQRIDERYQEEFAHWAPASGSGRRDGVPDTAYPIEHQETPPHYPERAFWHGRVQGMDVGTEIPGETGTVCVLETATDDRVAWLAAGQALQRVLLHASAEHYTAALHTQALEIPAFRTMISERLCAGRHPQMIFRLGRSGPVYSSVRRDITEVVYKSSDPLPN